MASHQTTDTQTVSATSDSSFPALGDASAGDAGASGAADRAIMSAAPSTEFGSSGDTLDQDVNGLLHGTAWDTPGTLTYSFPSSSADYGSDYSDAADLAGFQPLSDAEQEVARLAFGMIAGYTNLTFIEAAETPTDHATIRLAASSNPATSTTFYPADTDTGGDVFIGNVRSSDPADGSYAFDSILHEIGHSVGLKHGQDYDPTYGTVPADHLSTAWSVMNYPSYVGGPDLFTNAAGSGPQTYMADDISALQYLYGANFDTNSGDTTYTWDPSTGQEYINGVGQAAPTTDTIYETIWDGGGNDTYDLSNYTTDLTIDLQPGHWSTFDTAQLANLGTDGSTVEYAPGNVCNANQYYGDPRSLIENATGGSGNDTIEGNSADNVLCGGPGNNTLVGNGGTDTALYEGDVNEYLVTALSDGQDTVTGPNDSDQLYGISDLQFGAGPRLDVQAVAADDYAGNATTTGTIAAGGSDTGTIGFAGDWDWFATTLTAGTPYEFSLTGVSGGQGALDAPYLRLIAADGATQLTTGDAGNAGQPSVLTYTPTDTGTYFISAESGDQGTGAYLLNETIGSMLGSAAASVSASDLLPTGGVQLGAATNFGAAPNPPVGSFLASFAPDVATAAAPPATDWRQLAAG